VRERGWVAVVFADVDVDASLWFPSGGSVGGAWFGGSEEEVGRPRRGRAREAALARSASMSGSRGAARGDRGAAAEPVKTSLTVA
jgi:hypothetical protein